MAILVEARWDIASVSPVRTWVTMPSCTSAASFGPRLLVSTAMATVLGVSANACWLANATSTLAVKRIRMLVGLLGSSWLDDTKAKTDIQVASGLGAKADGY